MTFFDRIQSYPPILVRLLARHKGGAPLTTEEICANAATTTRVKPTPASFLMGVGTIATTFYAHISQQTDWLQVPFMEGLYFMRGCHVDFCNAKEMRRVDDYLRKSPNLEYLRKSPEWDSYYKPLLIRWRRSYAAYPAHIPNNIHKPVRDLLIRLTPILNVNV